MFAKRFVLTVGAFTSFCFPIVASAQLIEIERGFRQSETPEAQSDSWASDGSETQPLNSRTPRASAAVETRQQPSGQYQRGKAIGINIVDAGQGKVAITYVHPDSPAEQAGLQPGDAIRRIDGRRVSSTLDVIEHIGRLGAQERVNLEVERAQRMRFFQVRLEARATPAVRGRGEGPEVQFSSQRTVEQPDGAYAYRAGYGQRQPAAGNGDQNAPATTTYGRGQVTEGGAYGGATVRPVNTGEQLQDVPSTRVLMQEISQLRRQLSDVRRELDELRRQVEGSSPSDRRARDLQQPSLPTETESYQYDGF